MIYNRSNKILLFLILDWLILFQQINFNQEVKFEHISINEGLSQGSVRVILNDHKGFIWFGTNDGLNRYDGYKFKIYKNDLSDSNSISNNYILCLAEDSKNNLWIGTSLGLNRYNRAKNSFQQLFISELLNDSTITDEILSIAVDKNINSNLIWISARSGLYEINYDSKKITRIELIDFVKGKKSFPKTIFNYDNESLLVGMSNGLLLKIEKKSKIVNQITFRNRHNSDIIESITTICRDSLDNLWIGTNTGIYNLNKNVNEVIPFNISDGNLTKNMYVNSLAADKSNNLWIATSGSGLVKYNIQTKSFSNFVNDPFNQLTIGFDVLLTVYADKTGVIWIGSNGNGIDRYNIFTNKFKLFVQSSNGLSFKSVRGIYKDSNSNIYIGGYGLLNKYDAAKKSYKKYLSSSNPDFGMSSNSIYSIISDKDSPDKILWIGTEGSRVLKLDLQTNQVVKRPFKDYSNNKNQSNSVYTMYDDGKGFLWIGTENGLDIINKSSGKFEHYENNPEDNSSIGLQRVVAIFHDSKGNKWIGTDLNGLCLFNTSTKTFKKFMFDPTDPKSISNNSVKTIYEDKKGRLWIGTDGGGLNLFELKNQSFKRITKKDGLPNDVVYGILEDHEGNLWLSTNYGLCKYNPGKNKFTNYDVKDGLQSNEFNTSAYYKSTDGELFFGGVYGLNSFYPERFNFNKTAPRIVLTELQLFNSPVSIDEEINGRVLLNKAIDETDTIEFDYDENIFSIEFAALDFASPSKNQYSYRLEGFESKWTQPRTDRKATYTNLNPGKYVFKVKGSNNDDVWSQQPAQLIIIIHPPFWNTWWFKLIMIFVGVAIIALVYAARVRVIKNQKEKLEKEVRQRTSELAKLNRDLIKSENELKEINTSKDRFLSILAHDLKGPFIGVIGLSEILLSDLDELTKNEIKEISSDINLALNEQYILLENLLDWSRIQINKFDLQLIKINLNMIVGKVLRFLMNSAKSKNISLVNNVPVEIYINADPTLLRSIIQNLIANAIKFSNENSIVKINAITLNHFAQIEVEDNGIGIDEAALHKIFHEDRLHTTIGTAKEKGTGLGLMLVKELVRKHHGDIKVESIVGKGSKFIFTMPLDVNENSDDD